MGSASLDKGKDDINLFLGNFMDLVYEEVKDKRVLDVGCAGHDLGTGLHKYEVGKLFLDMGFYARSITGVDNYEEMVTDLRRQGYNIICGNIEDVKLRNGFYDVVSALAIIEHLDNQGLFLRNVHKCLSKKGKLLVFTINAFSIRGVARALLNGFVPVNSEHSVYYDVKTLRHVLERNGFRVVKAYYVFGGRNNWSEFLERWVARYVRKIYAPNLFFVCEKR